MKMIVIKALLLLIIGRGAARCCRMLQQCGLVIESQVPLLLAKWCVYRLDIITGRKR